MSGHSKWHNIKHKKMAEDSRRGKIFTKHAKLIAMAARNNPDPDLNPLLKSAIDTAKAENVPNDNIERAIKKGAGADKNTDAYEEVLYEAFGPGGVAILILAITDNRNRALGNIKVILTKKNGRLAQSGSVSWMFNKVGEIIVETGGFSADKMEALELELIDCGADDISILDENSVRVLTSSTEMAKVRNEITKLGYTIEAARLIYEPKTKVKQDEIGSEYEPLQILLEALENNDDVDEIYTNLE